MIILCKEGGGGWNKYCQLVVTVKQRTPLLVPSVLVSFQWRKDSFSFCSSGAHILNRLNLGNGVIYTGAWLLCHCNINMSCFVVFYLNNGYSCFNMHLMSHHSVWRLIFGKLLMFIIMYQSNRSLLLGSLYRILKATFSSKKYEAWYLYQRSGPDITLHSRFAHPPEGNSSNRSFLRSVISNMLSVPPTVPGHVLMWLGGLMTQVSVRTSWRL